MCGVWGDPPTALSGDDSCHQLTEGDTPSSVLHCSHALEWGGAICTVVASHSHACDVQYQCSNYQFVPSCWLMSQQMRDAHTTRGIKTMLLLQSVPPALPQQSVPSALPLQSVPPALPQQSVPSALPLQSVPPALPLQSHLSLFSLHLLLARCGTGQ